MEAYDIAKLKLKALGITQTELAEMFEVEQPQVSNALNGKNQTTLARIITYLIEKKGIDRREFYPDDNERLLQLEIRVKNMGDKVDRVYEMLKSIIKNNHD